LQWNTRPGPAEGLITAAARDVTDSRARKEQAALHNVANLVAHGATPTEVLDAVAAEVASLLEADFSLVGRYELDATLTHVAMNPTRLVDEHPRVRLEGDDLASLVQRTGEPAWISYDDAPGLIAALARKRGVRTAVAAPILVDDRIWGVTAAGGPSPASPRVK
jgi:GAF domain-containing protein